MTWYRSIRHVEGPIPALGINPVPWGKGGEVGEDELQLVASNGTKKNEGFTPHQTYETGTASGDPSFTGIGSILQPLGRHFFNDSPPPPPQPPPPSPSSSSSPTPFARSTTTQTDNVKVSTAMIPVPDDLHQFVSGVCIPIREFYVVLEGNFPGIMLNQGMLQKAISGVRHPHYVTCFTYSEAWAEYMKGMDEKNYYVTRKNVHRYKRARLISSSGDEKEEEKRREEEEARPLGTSEEDLHAEKVYEVNSRMFPQTYCSPQISKQMIRIIECELQEMKDQDDDELPEINFDIDPILLLDNREENKERDPWDGTIPWFPVGKKEEKSNEAELDSTETDSGSNQEGQKDNPAIDSEEKESTSKEAATKDDPKAKEDIVVDVTTQEEEEVEENNISFIDIGSDPTSEFSEEADEMET